MAAGKAVLVVFARVGSVVTETSRHPLTVLEERLGEVLEDDYAETASVVAPLAVALYATLKLPADSHLHLLAVWAVVFGLLATRRAPRRTDDVERDMLLADARRAYVEGRIDEAEYERRITLLLDRRARRIREVVEEVSGVGPELSAALALRFDSVDDLERASREDLEEIHGVGASTADALLAYLGDEDESDGVEPLAGADHVDEPDAADHVEDGLADEGEDDVASGEHERADSGAVDRAVSEQDHAQVAVDGRPDLDLAEVLALRQLMDDALDPESDVSVEDLESVPRAALRDGVEGRPRESDESAV